MSRWRKRPVEVEAVPYKLGLEDGFDDLGEAINNGLGESYELPDDVEFKGVPFIKTLEGKHYIHRGDWIITGVKGERYPCKDDIFRATYEPAGPPHDVAKYYDD